MESVGCVGGLEGRNVDCVLEEVVDVVGVCRVSYLVTVSNIAHRYPSND